jgi:hypothetical protein
MATLPDLDTSKVGMIGYWNATNHGVSEIDPIDAIDFNKVTEYTQYDNGLQGKLEVRRVGEKKGEESLGFFSGVDDEEERGPENIEFNFRMKSDGWILVWTDRTNQFGPDWFGNNTEGYRGYYDITFNWSAPRTGQDKLNYNTGNEYNISLLPKTEISVKIKALQEKLSNSGNITFNHSDVDYYCYEFPNANRMAQSIELFGEGFTDYNTQEGFDAGVSYPSNTNKKYHAVFASVSTAEENDGSFELLFNDTTITPSKSPTANQNTHRLVYGSIDAIGQNLVPDKSTTYYNDNTFEFILESFHIIFHLILYEKT